MKNSDSNKHDSIQQPQQSGDPRKHPKPGYDEKNPENKNDVKKKIQDHPEDQNSG